MIKRGRIVDEIGPAGNGLYGSKIVKIALADPPVEVTAYAKKLNETTFLVELLSSMLASALDLPTPEPIIAFSEDGSEILFATIKIDYPDLSQRLTLNGDAVADTPENRAILKLVSDWVDLERAAAFDEWIANGDRNVGNVLFNGKDAFYLIDHNLAMRPHFSANTAITDNGFLTIKLIFARDDLSKQRIRSLLQHIIESYDPELPEQLIVKLKKNLNPDSSTDLDKMLDFLKTRLEFLANIATSQVPVKQLSL